MIVQRQLFRLFLISISTLFLVSCGGAGDSSTTGWAYNDTKNGGFEVAPFEEQETGPGLVLVEGGTFVMGRTEQDPMFRHDNLARRVSVNSFYLDQTEVRNVDYLEYLYWLNRVFAIDYPRIVQKALPDTLVWREKLAFNEPMVDFYLRHPAYRDYPVVGVNWLQARDYCNWRSDRVNEFLLVQYGILKHYPQQVNDDHFNTDAYLSNQYEGDKTNKQLEDLSPNGDERRVRMEDGIFLPKYRLPTETEWEFAALGLIGNTMYERVVERRLYPWNGHITRTDDKHNYGDMVANFKRGRGDYMGVAGNLNDAAAYTAPVYAYWPNDYGLYNMAGNVSEWVMDVYRPLSFEDVDDMSAFRGNVYKTYVRDNDGAIEAKLDYILFDYEGIQEWLVGTEQNPNSFKKNLGQEMNPAEAQLIDKLEKHIIKAIDLNNKRKFDEASDEIILAMDEISGAPDEVEIANELYKGFSDFILAQPGDLREREVTIEENLERRNYRKANNINYLDGDYASTYDDTKWDAWKDNDGSKEMYDYSATSMLNDKARVYKGGSWRDGAYWLSPGTRRFLDQRQSTSTIGFRCAMTRVGSPIGNY
ncbi:MAG: SUMF1/EgtB/PvdO family nonheme iron enzyme [Bacteroidales bacterium]|nr:SUMF1/EgtB/PvdO family nonheme iron enzyme [Bacteroidales bacterium]